MLDALRVADPVFRSSSETPIARVLRERPSAIFCDIDGTISPIVETPEQARVLPAARDALARIAQHVDLICFLTGRPADDAWRMVGLDGALYVGNHGAETWRRGELLRPAGIERWHVRLARASAILRVALANVPGLVWEDKGIGFAIHFRRQPSQAQAVRDASERVARRRGLQVLLRSEHVEIRAPVPGDKGSAVRELAGRHALRGLVVLGDDPVDAPAFDGAREHAARTGASALTVTVGPFDPPGDVVARGPQEVSELLASAARELAA